MSFVARSCCHCRLLALLFFWSLIRITLITADSDASTFFPDEDTILFTVADSSAIDAEEREGGFSSDLFTWPSSSSSSSGLNILGLADDLDSSTLGYEMDLNLGNWDDDN